MRHFLRIYFTIILCISATLLRGQVQDSTFSFTESIAVTARPSLDSITLRWAPLRLSVWQLANKNGYTVERFVMARNGKVLNAPERSTITSAPLKPIPEDDWEPIVKRDRFGAVAAQAIYGDNFEVDLSKTDIFTIVNKVQENEQRFSFALFSADMSPEVAKASGLWFTDKKVKKGEKYLYRISIVNATADTLRGSIFISPEDAYALVKPRNLKADFKDQMVSLRWDKTNDRYTAYIVERSDDGKTFKSISDIPLVTVSPKENEETRYEYVTDSLPDLSKTYYYRVRGITPFGEKGNPSEVVSGKGYLPVNEVPYISSGVNVDNKSILVTWEFPAAKNAAIKGFSIERSRKPKGDFVPVMQGLVSPTSREYVDKAPEQINYYRVTANALNGEKFISPLYYAQLVDSIPPLNPVGLKATIDDFGTVQLSWTPNPDIDIFGYRVYKSNNKSEELAQLTSEPISTAMFTDKANLKTLNEYVYYSVMAIDRNQNQSGLSELLKVNLPDKIKPQPPVFLPFNSDAKGVQLAWMRSGSEDVVHYDVYRQASIKEQWLRLKIVPAVSGDSTYHYIDENVEAGKTNRYTIIAVDDAGLESEPAAVITAGKINNALKAAVEWKEHALNNEKNQVILKWAYELKEVSSFRIYRGVDGNTSELYKSVSADKRDFMDTLIPGKKYTYRIMAIFEKGNQSTLSKELVFNY
jgi:uncharacterized protein